jgi:DNA replicative helicase MCM subunit Mcm2 (Cdc46/Mcm family)
MAKLYLRDTVEQTDVDEAIKLMDYSIKTLNADNSKIKKPSHRQDELSKIIGLVRDINTKFEAQKKTPDVQDCLKELKRSMGGKCDEDKLRLTLEHYQKLNVVYVDNKDKIYFV